jgi:hypothetical protein
VLDVFNGPIPDIQVGTGHGRDVTRSRLCVDLPERLQRGEEPAFVSPPAAA